MARVVSYCGKSLAEGKPWMSWTQKDVGLERDLPQNKTCLSAYKYETGVTTSRLDGTGLMDVALRAGVISVLSIIN